jgi:hypothetical protein
MPHASHAIIGGAKDRPVDYICKNGDRISTTLHDVLRRREHHVIRKITKTLYAGPWYKSWPAERQQMVRNSKAKPPGCPWWMSAEDYLAGGPYSNKVRIQSNSSNLANDAKYSTLSSSQSSRTVTNEALAPAPVPPVPPATVASAGSISVQSSTSANHLPRCPPLYHAPGPWEPPPVAGPWDTPAPPTFAMEPPVHAQAPPPPPPLPPPPPPVLPLPTPKHQPPTTYRPLSYQPPNLMKKQSNATAKSRQQPKLSKKQKKKKSKRSKKQKKAAAKAQREYEARKREQAEQEKKLREEQQREDQFVREMQATGVSLAELRKQYRAQKRYEDAVARRQKIITGNRPKVSSTTFFCGGYRPYYSGYSSDEDTQCEFLRPDGSIEGKTESWCREQGFEEVGYGLWSGPWYYKPGWTREKAMVEEEERRSKDPMWIKRRQEAAEAKKRAQEAAVEAKIRDDALVQDEIEQSIAEVDEIEMEERFTKYGIFYENSDDEEEVEDWMSEFGEEPLNEEFEISYDPMDFLPPTYVYKSAVPRCENVVNRSRGLVDPKGSLSQKLADQFNENYRHTGVLDDDELDPLPPVGMPAADFEEGDPERATKFRKLLCDVEKLCDTLHKHIPCLEGMFGLAIPFLDQKLQSENIVHNIFEFLAPARFDTWPLVLQHSHDASSMRWDLVMRFHDTYDPYYDRHLPYYKRQNELEAFIKQKDESLVLLKDEDDAKAKAELQNEIDEAQEEMDNLEVTTEDCPELACVDDWEKEINLRYNKISNTTKIVRDRIKEFYECYKMSAVDFDKYILETYTAEQKYQQSLEDRKERQRALNTYVGYCSESSGFWSD